MRRTATHGSGHHRRLALTAGIMLAAPVILSLVGATRGDGREFIVSPTGSDSASGSATAPWRTVAASLRKLSPGDTLFIRGGTYVEDVAPTLPRGTAAARITVRNYPGEIATIQGLVRFTDPDYWTIQGLRFVGTNATGFLVKLTAGTGWLFEANQVYSSPSSCVLIAASATHGAPVNWVVRGNSIHDCGLPAPYHSGHALYVNPSATSTGGLIERNLLYNASHGAVKLGFGGTEAELADPLFGINDVVFRYNTLFRAWQPLIIAEPATNVDVYRNLIAMSTRSPSYLVRLDGATANRLGPNILVHDNLGHGADKYCEDFAASYGCAKADTGANVFPRDPLFDSTTNSGFHPGDPVAQAYGRWAPAVPTPPTADPSPITPAPATAAPTPLSTPTASPAPTAPVTAPPPTEPVTEPPPTEPPPTEPVPQPPSEQPAPIPTPEPSASPTAGSPTSVSFRSGSAAKSDGTSALRILTPAEVVAGDVLVASVDVRGKATVTTPPGWTRVLVDRAGTVLWKATYYRVVTATEPASHEWSLSGGGVSTGTISAFSGVDVTTPIRGAAASVNGRSDVIRAPLVSLVGPGAVSVFYGVAAQTALEPPAGMIESAEIAALGKRDEVTSESSYRALSSRPSADKMDATAAEAARSIVHVIELAAGP